MFGSEKEDINESLPVTTQQDDSTAIELTDNTIISDNTSTTTSNTTPVSTEKKSSDRRQNITDGERAAAKDKTPTYGGATGDNANPAGGRQNADSTISPEMIGQDGEESKGYQEEAANGEKEDIKVEQNTDPSFTIDDNTSEEEKSDAGNINGSTDTGSENTSWGDIYKGNDTVQK